jgi:hypothetical protein
MEDLLDFIWSVPVQYVTWVPLGIGVLVAVGLFMWSVWHPAPKPWTPPPYTPLPVQPLTSARAEDPWLRGSATERRRYVRRRGNPVPVLVRLEDDTTNASGMIVDRSPGGLGLEINQEVPVGCQLRIRPSSVGDEVPWVELEVRHCRQVGDSWRIGGPFTKPITASVRWLLG